MTIAVTLAWAAMVLSGAVVVRPTRSRTATLARPIASRRAGRTLDPRVRRAATTVCFVVPVAVLFPLAAFPIGAGIWMLPVVTAKRAANRLALRAERDLPEIVDLLLLATGAGLSVRQAVAAVARRSATRVAIELGRAVAEAERGRRLADALDDVPGRAGECVRPVIAALTATERYGSPLVPALERLAADVRARARRRAEEAARRVPVKLLFPLVLCILPAFALLTVAPLIASALRTLRL
jgi:tight adherence protein C